MDALLLTYGTPPSWNASGAVSAGVHTARGLTREQWVRSRHAAAVKALEDIGIPYAQAWWVAVALMGHWSREVGADGHAELDCAVGNIRASTDYPLVHYLQGSDDVRPAPYRAYPADPNCEAGVADSVRLAAQGSRYRPVMQALLASESGGPYVVTYGSRSIAFPIDAENFYRRLMLAGWHPYSDAAMAEYRGTVTSVARIVGAPPFVASPWGKAVLGAGVTTLLGAIVYAAWRR